MTPVATPEDQVVGTRGEFDVESTSPIGGDVAEESIGTGFEHDALHGKIEFVLAVELAAHRRMDVIVPTGGWEFDMDLQIEPDPIDLERALPKIVSAQSRGQTRSVIDRRPEEARDGAVENRPPAFDRPMLVEEFIGATDRGFGHRIMLITMDRRDDRAIGLDDLR